MLLFKSSKNDRSLITGTENSRVQMRSLGWPPISLATVVLAFILASLAWYPSFISLKEETLALEQDQKKLLRQSKILQSLLDKSNHPIWLDNYSWLTWQAETERADLFRNSILSHKDKGATPLLFYISLQGASSYQEWMTILNKLFDQYSLRPSYEQIYWLENGLLDMNLQLQFVPKKFAVKKYQPLPNRFYQTWPKDIEVLAALKWQDKRILKMRVEERDLSLELGDWVPALAANLVSLSDKQAVFQQQYMSSTFVDQAQPNLVLNYLNTADLSDVNLQLDLERGKQGQVEGLPQVALRYEGLEDDI